MHNYKEAGMNRRSTAEKITEGMAFTRKNLEQYYSVEIPIPELNIIYQFKIWDFDSSSMSILIREDSNLLNWVGTGDRIKMKYYSYNPIHKYQELDTDFIDFERQGHGRLRGHYLAGLEIIEKQTEDAMQWPYRPYTSNIVPFRQLTGNYSA
jgi:hypothetical protein